MREFALTLALMAGLVVATVPTAPVLADDDALITKDIPLPAVFKGGFGSTDHVNLEATVVRPKDDKPHPLALINHGMTSEPDERHEMSPRDMLEQAEQFARRGWTA